MNDASGLKDRGRFRNAWLRRLRREYLSLAAPFGPALKPAGLGLMKSKTVWGRWQARERRILISEELILGHPWTAVEGILAHEIIHQAAWELYPEEARREPPHGPLFQRLGAERGVHPFYLAASVELRDSCPLPCPDPRRPLEFDEAARALERVRKLLALSSSPVEAEAQAAMNAAARLMARHNLDRLEREPDRGDYEYLTIELGVSRLQMRHSLIAGLLSRHFFVHCIFTHGYDAGRDLEVKGLELMGRPENIRLAEHVFHFLMERSESLWREYRRASPGGGQAARNSYLAGLLDGFGRKLDRAAASSADLGDGRDGFSALVLAKDRGLADYCRRRYPRTRLKKFGRRSYDPAAGEAGEAAGQALNFNRPVERSAPAATALIMRPDI